MTHSLHEQGHREMSLLLLLGHISTAESAVTRIQQEHLVRDGAVAQQMRTTV